jgi:hypothetical protein
MTPLEHTEFVAMFGLMLSLWIVGIFVAIPILCRIERKLDGREPEQEKPE